MKRLCLRCGQIAAFPLLATVLVFFAGHANGAPTVVQAASCGLMNRTTTPFRYLVYQTRLRKGMTIATVQEQLTGKDNLILGLSYAQVHSPLPPHFTGDLKLHDGLGGMFGDEGSTWLALTFLDGRLQDWSVWFNQG